MDVNVSEADLLAVPRGPRTEACLRNNCVVGVQYLEAWLGGLGCVPLYNLMEDAATAEICRTQVGVCHQSHQFFSAVFPLCHLRSAGCTMSWRTPAPLRFAALRSGFFKPTSLYPS